jgi:hypothetical protein
VLVFLAAVVVVIVVVVLAVVVVVVVVVVVIIVKIWIAAPPRIRFPAIRIPFVTEMHTKQEMNLRAFRKFG